MKKTVQYLGEYGLLKTIIQIFRRVGGLVGLLKSKTYILRKEIQEDLNVAITSGYQIKTLDVNDIEAFNKMKYFNFLDANNVVESKKAGATIALDENSIIAYVCYDSSSEHVIHKFGSWYLDENEAWVGPTYVKSAYRNKGLHRDLLSKTIENLQNNNIKMVVTAINYKNKPSIKSFEKSGFSKLGLIKLRNFIGCYSIIQVEEYTLNSIKSKFSNNKERGDI